MKKILIVDDDKKISLSLGVRLRKAGFEVLTAFDGVMAVGTAVKEKPDLILLDVMMPAGDGPTVAERIQGNTATVGVPIIFLTASKEPGLKERCLDTGAVAFFEKPYEFSELLAAIEEALPEKVN